MVAWTGIEHFQMGRFDPPPPANEPEDAVVCLSVTLNFGFFCHAFVWSDFEFQRSGCLAVE